MFSSISNNIEQTAPLDFGTTRETFTQLVQSLEAEDFAKVNEELAIFYNHAIDLGVLSEFDKDIVTLVNILLAKLNQNFVEMYQANSELVLALYQSSIALLVITATRSSPESHSFNELVNNNFFQIYNNIPDEFKSKDMIGLIAESYAHIYDEIQIQNGEVNLTLPVESYFLASYLQFVLNHKVPNPKLLSCLFTALLYHTGSPFQSEPDCFLQCFDNFIFLDGLSYYYLEVEKDRIKSDIVKGMYELAMLHINNGNNAYYIIDNFFQDLFAILHLNDTRLIELFDLLCSSVNKVLDENQIDFIDKASFNAAYLSSKEQYQLILASENCHDRNSNSSDSENETKHSLDEFNKLTSTLSSLTITREIEKQEAELLQLLPTDLATQGLEPLPLIQRQSSEFHAATMQSEQKHNEPISPLLLPLPINFNKENKSDDFERIASLYNSSFTLFDVTPSLSLSLNPGKLQFNDDNHTSHNHADKSSRKRSSQK